MSLIVENLVENTLFIIAKQLKLQIKFNSTNVSISSH